MRKVCLKCGKKIRKAEKYVSSVEMNYLFMGLKQVK